MSWWHLDIWPFSRKRVSYNTIRDRLRHQLNMDDYRNNLVTTLKSLVAYKDSVIEMQAEKIEELQGRMR